MKDSQNAAFLCDIISPMPCPGIGEIYQFKVMRMMLLVSLHQSEQSMADCCEMRCFD